MLELAYKHLRTGKRTVIKQAVRLARQEPFELNVGARASLVCWGVMPSRMLRHPLFSELVLVPAQYPQHLTRPAALAQTISFA